MRFEEIRGDDLTTHSLFRLYADHYGQLGPEEGSSPITTTWILGGMRIIPRRYNSDFVPYRGQYAGSNPNLISIELLYF